MEISQAQACAALVDWMNQYRVPARIAADVLGVSRRTLDRWTRQGRAPVRVAHSLDQIYGGAWVRSRLNRGAWTALRDNDVRRRLYGADWMRQTARIGRR